jgi:cytidylate kinase
MAFTCHADPDMDGMDRREDLQVQIHKAGLVVAIDGPTGSGKSTLARALAERLSLPYVNTGSMYRALAARALADGVDPDDEHRLERLAMAMRFSLSRGRPRELRIDGRPPGKRLSSAEVEGVVSRVARHPAVRSVMRHAQRALGARGSVMEGRDIGTRVFPDADLKVFLSARSDVRARRREAERGGGSDVANAVDRRDRLDARTNPLVAAPDAVVLDSTSSSPEALVRRVLHELALRGRRR